MIQLDRENQSALRLQPGYSGGPVIVEDQWGDAVIGMLAVAGRDHATNDAYAIPSAEIAAAWPAVLGRAMIPPCPYRGLRTFTEADAQAGLFVGREKEVVRLKEMVARQPLSIVTGPSGVGKSSLVAAGLTPALNADGWSVASFRPGPSPYEAVARVLLELERPAGKWTLEDLDHRTALIRAEGFWPVAARIALASGRRIAVVGDQFEEVLSSSEQQPREVIGFLQHLFPEQGTASNPDVRLICTLRSDFLPDLLELPSVGARIQDRQLNVSPLDRTALTRVVVEPAAITGTTFAEGLPELLAAEASEGSGGLPLLEFALTELWEQQRQGQITFDSYHALGGVPGALNRHAEHVYHALAEQVTPSRIRRVLLSMVRARSGAADAVRTTARRDHLRQDWQVAQMLATPENRLVVLGTSGSDTAELAHEAMIRGWHRLTTWVNADADFQKWLTIAEERAAEGDLLSEQRVTEAKAWIQERSEDIPAAVQDLVRDSRKALELQEKTEQLLGESQQLNKIFRERFGELERRQKQLQESNAALEEKAEQVAETNRRMEEENRVIEEARQVLEERAEQLSLSIRYKSEFLANMSHELRTPLNSLLILAKLLADNTEGNLSRRQVEFAETIHGAGSDLLQLLNDILDLSKVEAGKMDINLASIPLVEVADHVEAIFRPLITEKGLSFSVRVSAELPTTFHTDKLRLLQVLRNLLSNAVKFTDSGSIELVIRSVRTDAPDTIRQQMLEHGLLQETDAEVLAFSVTDTGIGISRDAMDRIFEAFKQADGTTARRYGGTGLGLSISREIARLLGGEIHAASKPGRGSTFTLYLPLHHFGPPAPERSSADLFHGHRGTSETRPAHADLFSEHEILSASTSPEDRTILRRELSRLDFMSQNLLIVNNDIRAVFALTDLLEKHRLHVLYAAEGREARKVLDHHRVALALVDMLAPRIDELATHPAAPPILAMTNFPVETTERNAQSFFSAYIRKPIDNDRLLTVLSDWIDWAPTL
ncbi:histidine kinase [Streptomyces sp. NHF165]|nr:histidine kinase [Streptomyces sp. NHF165]